MRVIAKEIVGENAISMQSGKNLYEKISRELISGGSVEIDFSGVKIFASPFFNASIGLLLKDINIDELQKRLSIINLSAVDRHLLNHVIANAIEYYKVETKIAETLEDIGKNKDDN